MTEMTALLQRSDRYLKSAALLLDDGDYESAVSRTYYAMLYAAQAVLLTKNLSFSSHSGVITLFGEHFIKTGVLPRDLGRELNRAFSKRQLGDYTHTFVISKTEAEEMLTTGKRFVAKVKAYLQQ